MLTLVGASSLYMGVGVVPGCLCLEAWRFEGSGGKKGERGGRKKTEKKEGREGQGKVNS